MQRTPTCPNCCKIYSYKEGKSSTKPDCQTSPLLLECGHTFCEGCLVKFAKLQKTRILCPTCQEETPLESESEAGVKKLPLNIYLLGVLLYNKVAHLYSHSDGSDKLTTTERSQLSKQDTLTVTGRTSPGAQVKACEECCSKAAVYQCNKCDCVYCQKCFEEVHSASRTLRQHQAVPLVQASSSSICSVHAGKPLEFYDEDDGKAVCAHCVILEQQKGHKIITVQEASKDLKEQLGTSLDDTKKTLGMLEKSDVLVRKTHPLVKMELGQQAQEVREHFQHVHALIQSRETILIKELMSGGSGQEELDILHTDLSQRILDAKKAIKEAENALRNPCTLVTFGKEINKKLCDTAAMPCCAVANQDWKEPKAVIFPEETKTLFIDYGTVQTSTAHRFVLKKLSDVTEQELESTIAGHEGGSQDDSLESYEDFLMSASNSAAGRTLSFPMRFELVYVTHIKDPCDFMIQRVADGERLEMLMAEINKSCQGPVDYLDKVTSPRVGDLYCAQYSMDNLWYRACVTNITDKVTLDGAGIALPIVEVQYIDFGNSETVPATRLRKLMPEYVEVPGLAVTCSLMDIVPPRRESKWPVKAIRVFGSLCGDKPLMMSVFNRSGGKLFIDLKSPEDEPTQDDDRPASVRDSLVFLEVACFLSSESLPSPSAPLTPSKVYKDAVLPETGELVDVLVTHVTQPDDFYIQIMGKSIDSLAEIMEDLNTIYTKQDDNWKILWPYKGLTCAARFSEDQSWYRAVIVGVTEEDGEDIVEVLYVDFGNSESLSFSEIRKLPGQHLQLPRQALNCSLSDTQPSPDPQWSAEAMEFFSECVSGKAFVGQVKEIKPDRSLDLLLFDTTSDKAVSISELLVVKNFADSSGLGFVRSQEELFKVVEEAEAKAQLAKQSAENEQTSADTQTAASEGGTQDDAQASGMVETELAPQKLPTEEESTTLRQDPAQAGEGGEGGVKTWGDIMEERSVLEEKDEVIVERDEKQNQETENLVSENERPEQSVEDEEEDTEADVIIEEEEGSTISEDSCRQTTEMLSSIISEANEESLIDQESAEEEERRPRQKLLQYKPPLLPAKKRTLVSVTFVNEDGHVFAQEVKDDDKTLVGLMDALGQRYTEDSRRSDMIASTDHLTEGQAVCAMFSLDEMWYRAIVCKIMDEQNVVVKYVDFGNADIVQLPNIRVMDKKFMDAPIQCLTLALYGVELAREEDRYSTQALQVLAEMVIGQDCIINVKSSRPPDNLMTVKLRLVSTGQDVGEDLVAKGCARNIVNQEKTSKTRTRGNKNTQKKHKEQPRREKPAMRPVEDLKPLKSALLPGELPPDGTRFDVTVTQVDRPDYLYFQRVPPMGIDEPLSTDPDSTQRVAAIHLMELEELSLKMNEKGFFDKTPSIEKAWKGMLCCGKYIMDGMWYRAQVQEVISESPLTVKVVYVDYGTNEIVQANRLKAFPVDLLSLPVQATPCILYGFSPPDKPDGPLYENTQWPVKSMECLLELVAGKKLLAVVKDPNTPITVELFDRQFNEDDDFYLDVPIGQLLAEKGLAKYSSEAVQAVPETAQAHVEETRKEEEEREKERHQEEEEKDSSKDGTPAVGSERDEEENSTDQEVPFEDPEMPSYLNITPPKEHKQKRQVSLESFLASSAGFTSPKLVTPDQFASPRTLTPPPSGQGRADQGSAQKSTPQQADTTPKRRKSRTASQEGIGTSV